MTCSVPVIAIPAGKCSVKLKGTDYEDVVAWAEEVISVGRTNSVTFLPSALIFYAQQFFNIFSEDYKTVCEHITSHYGNAGNVRDVIEKVKSTPIVQKPTVDGDGNPIKKRRGRPPKKQWKPPVLSSKESDDNNDDKVKKIRIKRK